MPEWPLVTFTLLLGAAIGLAGISTLFGAFLRAGGMDDATLAQTLRPATVAAAVLAIVAFGASFLHLGDPLNAPNALRHAETPWLSWEILTTSAFVFFTCLTVLWSLWKDTPNLFMLLVCFIMGLMDTGFMGELYRNTAVTTWMHDYTDVMFFAGVVLSGGALGLVLIGPRAATAREPVRWMFVWAAGLSLGAFIAELVMLPSYMSFIASASTEAAETLPYPAIAVYQALGNVRCLHWVLAVIGVLLILHVASKAFRQERFQFVPAALAAFLLLSGTVFGRIAFHAIHALT